MEAVTVNTHLTLPPLDSLKSRWKMSFLCSMYIMTNCHRPTICLRVYLQTIENYSMPIKFCRQEASHYFVKTCVDIQIVAFKRRLSVNFANILICPCIKYIVWNIHIESAKACL